MRITAASWPSETDVITKADLTTADSRFVRPPRVRQSKASIECNLREIVPMGASYGDVLCPHVADEVMADGRVTTKLLRPVGKLDGSNYATFNAVERLDLPAELTREVADFDKAHR